MLKLLTVMLVAVLLTLHLPDTDARTCRSSAVKRQFDRSMGYPKGRKRYVVDHICALSVGGLDTIANMQYQTIVEGKKKDRIEGTEKGKRLYCTSANSLPKRTVFNCK